MAMSLLYALLDVKDTEDLEKIARKKSRLTREETLALKHRDLKPKQKKEVKAALYNALYAIVEGGDVNKDLNMAIGMALCNAISGNHLGSLQDNPGVQRLYTVLKPIVADAIEEID